VECSYDQYTLPPFQIHEHFQIVHTDGPKDTALYLAQVTRHLQRAYADITLVVCGTSELDEVLCEGRVCAHRITVTTRASSRYVSVSNI
jgi:hypothetical protein